MADLQDHKYYTITDQIKDINKRIRKIIGNKGKRSKIFWREIKPHRVDRVNFLKEKKKSQTKTQEKTIERVKEHFQDLRSLKFTTTATMVGGTQPFWEAHLRGGDGKTY